MLIIMVIIELPLLWCEFVHMVSEQINSSNVSWVAKKQSDLIIMMIMQIIIVIEKMVIIILMIMMGRQEAARSDHHEYDNGDNGVIGEDDYRDKMTIIMVAKKQPDLTIQRMYC